MDQASCHATIAGHSGSAIVLWQLKISAAESIKQAPTQLTLQWTADSEQPSRSHLLFQKWANCCSMFHVRPLFDQNLFHRAMQHPRKPKTFHNIEVASILMKASESQSLIKACLLHLQVGLPWCQSAFLNPVYCACWLSLFAEQNHTTHSHTAAAVATLRQLLGVCGVMACAHARMAVTTPRLRRSVSASTSVEHVGWRPWFAKDQGRNWAHADCSYSNSSRRRSKVAFLGWRACRGQKPTSVYTKTGRTIGHSSLPRSRMR